MITEDLQELKKDIDKALNTAGITEAESTTQPIVIAKNTKIAFVGLLQKSSRTQIMDIAKSNSITWKESIHPGINWLRASTAILKNLNENSDDWVIYQDVIKSSSTEQINQVKTQIKREDKAKRDRKEKTLIIESANSADTPEIIEETLEKALISMKEKRENKVFSDVYLKARKDEEDLIVNKVFASMIEEISQILSS